MRGDRLRALRRGRGESQKYLSELLGITEATIANYENGRSEPEALPLLRVSAHYGVSSEYLAGLTDDPARQTSLPPDWEQVVIKAMQNGYTPAEMERALRIVEAIKTADDEKGRKD